MTHIAKGHGRNLVCQESLSSFFACRDLSWCAIKSTSLKWLGFINNASSIPVHAIYARRHARTHTRTHARTHAQRIHTHGGKERGKEKGGAKGEKTRQGWVTFNCGLRAAREAHTHILNTHVRMDHSALPCISACTLFTAPAHLLSSSFCAYHR